MWLEELAAELRDAPAARPSTAAEGKGESNAGVAGKPKRKTKEQAAPAK